MHNPRNRGKGRRKVGKNENRTGQRNRQNEEIVGISLPPLVTGQLRCFLHLKIDWIRWEPHIKQKDVLIKIQWWGENGGITFRPVILNNKKPVTQKGQQVKYPVRCGPKQFAAYLQDMSALYINILHGTSGSPFAQVQVNDIAKLSATKPVQGLFPVYSTADKSKPSIIGDMSLSVAFQSISDSFQVTSAAIPTVDTYNQGGQTSPDRRSPLSPTDTGLLALDNPTVTNGTNAELKNKTRKSNMNADLSFIVGPGKQPSPPVVREYLEGSNYKSIKDQHEEKAVPSRIEVDLTRSKDAQTGSKQAKSLLSLLIERGQTLRERMVLSAVEAPQNQIKRKTIQTPPNADRQFGKLLKNILDDSSPTAEDSQGLAVESHHSLVRDLEKRAVDLCLGDEDLDFTQLMNVTENDLSPNISDLSEADDPLHDGSILEELFYANSKVPSPSEHLDEKSEGRDRKQIQTTPKKEKVTFGRPPRRSSSSFSEVSLENPGNIRPSFSRSNSVEDIAVTAEQKGVKIGKDDFVGKDDRDHEQKDVQKKREDNTRIGLDLFVPEGMSLNQLTLLGRVHVARVIINDLLLENQTLQHDLSARTFFVEYSFPVQIADVHSSKSEVIRVASKNFNERAVHFNHHTVFPIHFTGAVVENWWTQALLFRIFYRRKGERYPIFLGSGTMRLRHVLQAPSFSVKADVDIRTKVADNKGRTTSGDFDLNGQRDIGLEKSIGNLNVVVKLVTEKASDSNRGKDDSMEASPVQLQDKKEFTGNADLATTTMRTVSSTNILESSISETQPTSMNKTDDLNLEVLLAVDEGKSISMSSSEPAMWTGSNVQATCNLYLIVRMFWCDAAKSRICWNSNYPVLNFQQITPIVLNTWFLQRVKNNFVIIEVWNKSTSTAKDQLVGIVKLSTNQLCLSFGNPRICDTLLKAKYPVITCDDWKPVLNPFSGKQHGYLHVLLAVGTHDQTGLFLQTRGRLLNSPARKEIVNSQAVKESSSSEVGSSYDQTYICYKFQVTIMAVHNLQLSENTVWGECDCYIKYYFPEASISQTGDFVLTIQSTSTTLYTANPIFHFTKEHKIELPRGFPLQQVLLNAFGSMKCNGSLTFELWKRCYYPNIREQLLAKACLTIDKICAMVSFGDETSQNKAQGFSLPLHPTEYESCNEKTCGTLSIKLQYQQIQIVPEHERASENSICISVSIQRACGLKVGAEEMAKQYPKATYAADVGLNTYVKVYPSFLGPDSFRISKTVAKSFTPHYLFHMDFPVPLKRYASLADKFQSNDVTTSLAHLLESGFLICEVYHVFAFGSMETELDDIQDEMIGRCKIPLANLITRHTGIKGWTLLSLPNWSLNLQDEQMDLSNIRASAGAIDVNITFGKGTDRDLVINTGRALGWSLSGGREIQHESRRYHETKDPSLLSVDISVNCEQVWFPRRLVKNLWHTTTKHHKSFSVYARYIFFDEAAYFTKTCSVNSCSDGLLTGCFNDQSIFATPASESLAWYLREEKLEVQYWLTENETEKGRKTRDKLLGSSFVDMAALSEHPLKRHVVSGLYPLYRANADFLGQAYSRLSIELTVAGKDNLRTSANSELLSTTYPDDEDCTSLHSLNKESMEQSEILTMGDQATNKSKITNKADDANTINVEVYIEGGCHLPFICENDDNSQLPGIYVTYHMGDDTSLGITPVVKSSRGPTWNFRSTEKLSRETIATQELHFKVWSVGAVADDGTTKKDVLIGVAPVDMSPLAAGLRQINGWYNIYDFNDHIQGQLKIGVIPSSPLKTQQDSSSLPNIFRGVNWSASEFGQRSSIEDNMSEVFRGSLKWKSDFPYATHTNPICERFSSSPGTSKSALLGQLRGNLMELQNVTRALEDRICDDNQPSSITRDNISRVETNNEQTFQYKNDFSSEASNNFSGCLDSDHEKDSLNCDIRKNMDFIEKRAVRITKEPEVLRNPPTEVFDLNEGAFTDVRHNNGNDSISDEFNSVISIDDEADRSIISDSEREQPLVEWMISNMIQNIVDEPPRSADISVHEDGSDENPGVSVTSMDTLDLEIIDEDGNTDTQPVDNEYNKKRNYETQASNTQVDRPIEEWRDAVRSPTFTDELNQHHTYPSDMDLHLCQPNTKEPNENPDVTSETQADSKQDDDSFFSLQVPRKNKEPKNEAEVSNNIKSCKESVPQRMTQLPNFFMPINELTNTMKKFRLAANFGHSPTSFEGRETRESTRAETVHRQETRRVKLSISGWIPPIPDSEVSRIETIFSSNINKSR